MCDKFDCIRSKSNFDFFSLSYNVSRCYHDDCNSCSDHVCSNCKLAVLECDENNYNLCSCGSPSKLYFTDEHVYHRRYKSSK